MLVKMDLPTKVTRNNTEKKHPRATTKTKKTNPQTACWLANTGFTYLTQTSSQEQVAGINPAFSPTEITKNHDVFVHIAHLNKCRHEKNNFVTSDSTAWLMMASFYFP